MIWVGGRVVPDDVLRVSVLDRTFEHGLGLFETLRTWDGRAPLLEHHLARMKRSAEHLGLPYGSVTPPGPDAVSALLEAEGLGRDVMLRVTLSGGLSASTGATLWMRASPLPPLMRREGATVDLGSLRIHSADPFARHKTLNYWARRKSYERARELSFDETFSVSGGPAAGGILEGTRTNVFIVESLRREGDDSPTPCLMTPSTSEPIVPGVMRWLVLKQAREVGLKVIEGNGLSLSDAEEVFLTNSVRGIIPVRRVISFETKDLWEWPAPGTWTQRLTILVNDWLQSRGGSPT
jgi:branched-subunit amino acid aminotransferase/4-amino-4-deoxychorismate lyase